MQRFKAQGLTPLMKHAGRRRRSETTLPFGAGLTPCQICVVFRYSVLKSKVVKKAILSILHSTEYVVFSSKEIRLKRESPQGDLKQEASRKSCSPRGHLCAYLPLLPSRTHIGATQLDPIPSNHG